MTTKAESKHREAAVETWWTGGESPLKRAMVASLDPWMLTGDTTAIAAGSPHANLVKVLARIALLHAAVDALSTIRSHPGLKAALEYLEDERDCWSQVSGGEPGAQACAEALGLVVALLKAGG